MEPSEVRGCCRRAARDLLTDPGHVLEMQARLNLAEHFDDYRQWWDVSLTLDGEPIGSFGTYFPLDPEEFTAFLADYLQEHLSQTIWGGWPMCPDHANHPLEAMTIDARAVWRCPRGREIAIIGHLEPSVA
jgi:hypothetical protein